MTDHYDRDAYSRKHIHEITSLIYSTLASLPACTYSFESFSTIRQPLDRVISVSGDRFFSISGREFVSEETTDEALGTLRLVLGRHPTDFSDVFFSPDSKRFWRIDERVRRPFIGQGLKNKSGGGG